MLAAASFDYRPFLTPLPMWDHWVWLLLPLCVAVAVAWKCMKSPNLAALPREAAKLTGKIVLGYLAAAVVLWVVVQLV